jgi:hypothetical protein
MRQRKYLKHIIGSSAKKGFYGCPELESNRKVSRVMTDTSRYKRPLESFVARVTCHLRWDIATRAEELEQRALELLICVWSVGSLANKLIPIMSLPGSWTHSQT